MKNNLNVLNDTREPTVEAQDLQGGGNALNGDGAPDFKPQGRGQSAAQNSRFARLRREADAKQKMLEQVKQDNQRLIDALRANGIEGTFAEIAEVLEMAAQVQKDWERDNLISAKQEQALEPAALNEPDPFYEGENEGDIHNIADFLHDESNADKGARQGFLTLVNAGVDPQLALLALKAAGVVGVLPPPDIGEVNGGPPLEKDFYSPSDVDALTAADFKRDPGLLKKVKKSMTKWK